MESLFQESSTNQLSELGISMSAAPGPRDYDHLFKLLIIGDSGQDFTILFFYHLIVKTFFELSPCRINYGTEPFL